MERKLQYNGMRFIPLLCDIYPQFEKKAEKELNENEDNVRKGLQRLKDFVQEANLPSSIDDAFLLQFLRVAKFDLKKSEDKLARYLHTRRKWMAELQNVSLETFATFLDVRLCGLLPYRDGGGRAVVYSQGSVWESGRFDANEVALCLLTLCLFALSCAPSTVSGLAYIADSHLSTWEHYPVFKTATRQFPNILALPVRLQRIDIIKESPIYHYFLVGFRALLPNKIKNRIHVHGSNLAQLQKDYDSSILPFEFGEPWVL